MDTFLATYLQTHTTLRHKRQATFLYCALLRQLQAMVNREDGNPDVLDSYLGPDITPACLPLAFLLPFIVTTRNMNTLWAKHAVNTHSGKSCLAHAISRGGEGACR